MYIVSSGMEGRSILLVKPASMSQMQISGCSSASKKSKPLTILLDPYKHTIVPSQWPARLSFPG